MPWTRLLNSFVGHTGIQPRNSSAIMSILAKLFGRKEEQQSANASSIWSAIQKADLAHVRDCLRSDPTVVNQQNGSWTPLELAVHTGHAGVVELLLSSGADPNHIGGGGFRRVTPLFYAARGGHLDVARALLSHGANVNASDNFGMTPLHEATVMGQWDFGRFLVQNGASVNVKTTRELPVATSSKQDRPEAGCFMAQAVLPSGSTPMDALFGLMFEFKDRDHDLQSMLSFFRSHGGKYGSET
jgi:ankyrin repeat protein